MDELPPFPLEDPERARQREEYLIDMQKFWAGCGWGKHNWDLVAFWKGLHNEYRCTNLGCPRNKPLKNIPPDLLYRTGKVNKDSFAGKPTKSLAEDIAECIRNAGISVIAN